MKQGFALGTELGLRTSTEQFQQMRRILTTQVMQLSGQELRDYILREFETNPCLEIRENGDGAKERDGGVRTDEQSGNGEKNSSETELELQAEWEERVPYDDEMSTLSRAEREAMADRHQGMLENIADDSQTLASFLVEQLGALSISDSLRADAELIIYALDPRGFLLIPFDDEELFGFAPDAEERGNAALEVIQSLEPTGVGARDLRECLLLQIEEKEKESRLEDDPEEDSFDYQALYRFVYRYGKELECDDFEIAGNIAKKSGMSVREVEEMFWQIGRLRLNPDPGRNFSSGPTVPVEPDLYCAKNEAGEWYVTLADSDLPELTLTAVSMKNCRTEEEKKNLLRNKTRVLWLIEAIQKRNETMEALGNALVKAQADFLENGPMALRPLTRTQIAAQIERHVSTVSRATANKWIETPRGLLPLAQFFSQSTKATRAAAGTAGNGTAGNGTAGTVFGTASGTASGTADSRDVVKLRLRDLVRNEDRTEPLTDDQLAKMLSVARTTVNKYRKEMKIPSSRKRKRVK
ncbi:MAG: RNA polymerase factor sigma-54 [Thermoguttaceae bacterium]|nr:RNA polymerase factor sigma-54 [Thermoguttaceae bacterium]